MKVIRRILLVGIVCMTALTVVNFVPRVTTVEAAKTVTIPKKFRHAWFRTTKYGADILKIHKKSAEFYQNDFKLHLKIYKGTGMKHSYDLTKKNINGMTIKYRSSHKLVVYIDMARMIFKR